MAKLKRFIIFQADVTPSWPVQVTNGIRLLAFTLYLWMATRFRYHETFKLLMWMAREFFAGVQDVAIFFRLGGKKYRTQYNTHFS